MIIVVNRCLKITLIGHFSPVKLDVLRKVVDAARPFLELVQVGNGKLKVEAVLTTHQLLALRVDVGAGEPTFHPTLVVQLEGTVQLLIVIRISPTAVRIGIPQDAVIAVAHHKRNTHLRIVLEQLLVHTFIIEVFRLMLTQSVERFVGRAVELQVPGPAMAVVFSQLAVTNLTLRNSERLEGLAAIGQFRQQGLPLAIKKLNVAITPSDNGTDLLCLHRDFLRVLLNREFRVTRLRNYHQTGWLDRQLGLSSGTHPDDAVVHHFQAHHLGTTLRRMVNRYHYFVAIAFDSRCKCHHAQRKSHHRQQTFLFHIVSFYLF